MRIGILTNTLDTGKPGSTTYGLAAEAINRGHEVWFTSAGNLLYDVDDRVRASARSVPSGHYPTGEKLHNMLHGRGAVSETITVDDLDVLLLRSNPSAQREWAQAAGIHFGRLAMRHGVVVLSDPNGLAKAANKLYLSTYPRDIRPRTLVTRSTERIAQMLKEERTIILKPLAGYGGQGVFIARHDDITNLRQIVDSISRDGFVIAQEYIPAAAEGDTRFFLMNGSPLIQRGKYAAVRRIRTGEDVRSNIHAGGRIRRAQINDEILRVADVVRPRLVEDGMFLVGLDIAGGKLLEINVFSPGGFGSIQRLEGVNFKSSVIESIERKVYYMRHYKRSFSNVEICSL